MKFGESRTPHVEGLPTAIKAQAYRFFLGIGSFFFKGRKEESQKERSETTHKRGFSCSNEGFAKCICYRLLHPHYFLVIH